MEITKIKSVKSGFSEGSGPYEVIELGIMTEDVCVMFGTFYLGPGMEKESMDQFKNTECLIDSIISNNESFGA